jgi:branched-chain amino acid transport system substrate-binding protein
MLRRVFAFFFLLTLAAAAPARADEAFRIYDARGVRAIFDITNSGVGLAVQDLAKARDRIVIFDSASSSDLTGKACSSNGVQWNAYNWSNGVALMRLLIKEKLDSFFFITADYAFGASLEA